MELKACPFCSATDAVREYDGDGRSWVICRRCACEGPVVHKRQDEDDPHWNTRPIEDAKDTRIAALEADLARCGKSLEELWTPADDDSMELRAKITELNSQIAALEAKCERMAKCIEAAGKVISAADGPGVIRAADQSEELASRYAEYVKARAAVEEGSR